MKIYLGGNWVAQAQQCETGMSYYLEKFSCLILSFYWVHAEAFGFNYKTNTPQLMKRGGSDVNIFLDSGAFTAFTKDVKINMDEYIAFIYEYKDFIDVYANLDVIGDAKLTWQNQREMEKQGLSPMPVFHYGSDLKWLKKYAENYEYMGFGGVAGMGTNKRKRHDFFGKLFRISGDDTKIHGFGMTDIRLMCEFPWHSVDSSSWILQARTGGIYIVPFENGEWNYMKTTVIAISERSPEVKKHGGHYLTLQKAKRVAVDAYLEHVGVPAKDLMTEYIARDTHNILHMNAVEEFCTRYHEENLITSTSGKIQKQFF